ncbi:MAG: TolC family protein, partial [Verrucomicrobiota bacterium]
AAADEQIVTADFFPQLTLVASMLFIPENIMLSKQTQLVSGQSTLATEKRGGVGLTWRVIDNGQIIGARRRLDAVRQEYTLALHKLEAAVPRELATIAGALQTAGARHAAFVKSAAAAAENLQLIEARLALGQATQLDFLNAQSDLLGVRAGLVNAIAAHAVAVADLDRVTGRYLEFHTSTP